MRDTLHLLRGLHRIPTETNFEWRFVPVMLTCFLRIYSGVVPCFVNRLPCNYDNSCFLSVL